MGRGAYLARTKGGYDRPSKPSGSGGGGWSPSVGGGGGSQKNNQTGQNSSGTQENKQSGNEKAVNRLVELHNQGQGDSTQSQQIKYQLASSDAKIVAWNYSEN